MLFSPQSPLAIFKTSSGSPRAGWMMVSFLDYLSVFSLKLDTQRELAVQIGMQIKSLWWRPGSTEKKWDFQKQIRRTKPTNEILISSKKNNKR